MTSMASNSGVPGNRIWADEGALREARKIPYKQRISWLIKNTDRPIPEHKFKVLYEFMFKEAFKPHDFGPFNSLLEVIASNEYLYRKVHKDGRALIHDRLWDANKLAKRATNKDTIQKDTMSSIYKEPVWCLKLNEFNQCKYNISHNLDIFKDGQSLRQLNLTKLFEKWRQTEFRSFIAFGRCSIVDYYMCHPTISRIHCIFQFGPSMKLYLFDMSVYGTLVNNESVPSNKYIELQNNDTITFGDSSRAYKLSIASTNQNNQRRNGQHGNDSNNSMRSPNTMENAKQKQLQSKVTALQSQLTQLSVDLSESKEKEILVQNENNVLKNQINNLQKRKDPRHMGKPPMHSNRKEGEEKDESHQTHPNPKRQPKRVNPGNKRRRRQSKIVFEQESESSESEIQSQSESDSDSATDSGGDHTNNSNANNGRGREVRRRRLANTKNVGSSLQTLPSQDNRNRGGRSQRKFVIKGINFVDYVDNLSKLTVVKLKLYTDANNIQIGRIKKAALVTVIQKDLEKHM